MKLEDHQRARKLLLASRVEGIASADRQWLDAHLSGCTDCATEASALAHAVDSLRLVPVTAPAEMVRRTSLAVRRQAEQRLSQREPAVMLWVAAAISSLSAILMTPYLWSAFGWLGRMLHVGNIVWQLAFLMWWFMPATVLAAAAAWRHAAMQEMDRRHL
jgi:hypothetical protein